MAREIIGTPEQVAADAAMIEAVEYAIEFAILDPVKRDDVECFVSILESNGYEIRRDDDHLLAEIARLKAERDTPETQHFMRGVPLEAEHQRAWWGSDHDAGKTPFDWFWLVGYLAQKAATAAVAGDAEKAKHHTISTAAALANWHLALCGETDMRPGIGPMNGGEKPGSAFDLASKLDPAALQPVETNEEDV